MSKFSDLIINSTSVRSSRQNFYLYPSLDIHNCLNSVLRNIKKINAAQFRCFTIVTIIAQYEYCRFKVTINASFVI